MDTKIKPVFSDDTRIGNALLKGQKKKKKKGLKYYQWVRPNLNDFKKMKS